jgi:hypothetical protein
MSRQQQKQATLVTGVLTPFTPPNEAEVLLEGWRYVEKRETEMDTAIF